MNVGGSSESGIVLANVLVILAIAGSLVFVMQQAQLASLRENGSYAAATVTDSLLRGAETAFVSSLRRDAEMGSQTDHYSEPWAETAQSAVQLKLGHFAVSFVDVQSRFNLRSLNGTDRQNFQLFLRLLEKLQMPKQLGSTIAAAAQRTENIQSIADLPGLTLTEMARLAEVTDVLPQRSMINLNTADPVVLAALFRDDLKVGRLLTVRKSRGFLTKEDIQRLGLSIPRGTGFSSNVFEMIAVATLGGVTIGIKSRILRTRNSKGQVRVEVIRRQYGTDF